ncbi:MAG TPA: S1 RNA-binding domain-containing protein [Polyangiaceae bacterium LLY-WYZ-14_1]|nr:S1 RNA-binding domain-containing protein [Polyangiaceae bacterium LLY-WYZ-14_1]
MSEQAERPESEATPDGSPVAASESTSPGTADSTTPTPPADASDASTTEAERASSTGGDASGPAPAGAEPSPASAPTETAPPAPAPTETAAPAAAPTGGTADGPGADAAGDSSTSPEEGSGATGDGSATESGAAAATGETGAKKKRRRRKRKKKGEAGAAAGEGGATAGSDGDKKDASSHAAFARYFEGPGSVSRKHAFSAGEVVAGRVTAVHDGAFVVDLFGKATAVVDVYEPHEVPVLPDPPEATDEPPADGAADAGPGDAKDAAAADSGTTPAADAPTPPADAPTSPDAAPSTAAVEGSGSEASASEVASAAAPDAGSATPDAGSAATEAAPATPDAASAATEAAPATSDAASAAGEASDEDDDDDAGTPLEPEGPPPEPPAVGGIFRGRIGSVSESGNVALVNRLIDRPAVKAALAKAREERTRVRGVVFGFNRGGYDVLVSGVRVFCPASGMSLEIANDPREYVGRKFEFLVAPVKASGQGIVVTRRSILEREARKAARERVKSLTEGEVLEGQVTHIREFGVLVDIGDGVEGLVHQSELTYRRGVRPADLVRPGEPVKVKVLKVSQPQGRKKDARISLSIKALLPDPWDEHADVLQEGRPRKGKVVRATEFGAFVELASGIEGLLHISELGKDLKHASAAVKEGDEIDVVVERVDKKQRRVSLSRLSPSEAEAVAAGTFDFDKAPKSLRPGSDIQVVVDRVEHGGIAVRVAGVLGRRARGFIPNRELGEKGGDLRKKYPPGSEAEVRVVGIDRDGGLRCSFKAKEIDEERKAVQKYRKEAARQGFGTFGDVLRAKLEQAQNSGDG